MANFKLDLLQSKVQRNKQFTAELIRFCEQVESTLLQNDKSALIEEKVISISISASLMYVAGLVFSFTGVGLVFLLIGFLLSRQINKKLYGLERNADEINEQEKMLIAHCLQQKEKTKKQKMLLSLKTKQKHALFTDYCANRCDLINLFKEVKNHRPVNLALKYRANYSTLVKSIPSLLSKYDQVYKVLG